MPTSSNHRGSGTHGRPFTAASDICQSSAGDSLKLYVTHAAVLQPPHPCPAPTLHRHEPLSPAYQPYGVCKEPFGNTRKKISITMPNVCHTAIAASRLTYFRHDPCCTQPPARRIHLGTSCRIVVSTEPSRTGDTCCILPQRRAIPRRKDI